jgi:hypothetical protein
MYATTIVTPIVIANSPRVRWPSCQIITENPLKHMPVDYESYRPILQRSSNFKDCISKGSLYYSHGVFHIVQSLPI